MVYLFVIILLLFGIFRYDYCRAERGRKFYYILLLILFICVAGFRYRLGMDSVTYEHFFNSDSLHRLQDLTLEDFLSIRYMPGFVILASLCKTIYPDFMLLQFAVSIFLNCVVFWFLWKNTRHVFLALLLYGCFEYITLNMEVMREAMSVSFFLLAWPFFRDGKWIGYYLLIVCAFLCHVSAFLMFFVPLCLLPGIRWFFQYGKQTYIMCVIILIISVFVSLWFYRFIEAIAITESMAERSNAYENMNLGGNVVNFLGLISNIVRFAVYPLAAIYFLKKDSRAMMESQDMVRKQLLCILGIYIVLLSTGIFILTRYNNYLIFFSFILISDWAFSYIRKNNKKIRLNLMTWVIILSPLFLYQTYSAYWLNINKSGTLKSYMKYYPYASRFEMDKDHDREKVFRYVRRLF